MGRHLFQVPPHGVAPPSSVPLKFVCCFTGFFFHLVLHTYDCECFPFSPSSLPQLVGIIITVERADGPPFHLQRPMRHETVGAFFMRSIRYQEGGRASSASLMCKNPIWFCQSTCHRRSGHTLDDDPTCCCFFSRDHQHFFMQRCTCCSLEMSWGDFICWEFAMDFEGDASLSECIANWWMSMAIL